MLRLDNVASNYWYEEPIRTDTHRHERSIISRIKPNYDTTVNINPTEVNRTMDD